MEYVCSNRYNDHRIQPNWWNPIRHKLQRDSDGSTRTSDLHCINGGGCFPNCAGERSGDSSRIIWAIPAHLGSGNRYNEYSPTGNGVYFGNLRRRLNTWNEHLNTAGGIGGSRTGREFYQQNHGEFCDV